MGYRARTSRSQLCDTTSHSSGARSTCSPETTASSPLAATTTNSLSQANGTGVVTAYELQAEEDYRPDFLLVPLCGAGLKEEEILSHINECRAALNEFFSTMSPESRERTLMVFGALQKYSVTHRAAQNANPGPASFIVPRRAHTPNLV